MEKEEKQKRYIEKNDGRSKIADHMIEYYTERIKRMKEILAKND